MSSVSNVGVPQGSKHELNFWAKTLWGVGIGLLTICLALGMAAYTGASPFERTAAGLLFSAVVIAGAEWFSRRVKDQFIPSTPLVAGYFLAYFSVYATAYVPVLKSLESPYPCWGMMLVLGAIGTAHGTINSVWRRWTPAFTLLVTGHTLYHALSSTAVATIAGYDIKVSALSCLAGMLWCAGLSGYFKRSELKYDPNATDWEEWLSHRIYWIQHELYFVLAAVNAMALPVVLGKYEHAPLCWALEVPVLLAVSWRSGNWFKHSVVGAMWAFAGINLLSNVSNHQFQLASAVAVPAVGVAIGLAYRFLQSTMGDALKRTGYALYLYGATVVVLALPYLHFGGAVTNATTIYLVEAVVLCALGLALRDVVLHDVSLVASVGALVLVGAQFHTWTWSAIGPVICGAYAISAMYGYLNQQGGWKRSDFLTFGFFNREYVVSEYVADRLHIVWSWVGYGSLFAATYRLCQSQTTVVWWSLAALTLVTMGFMVNQKHFRRQGVLGFCLATAKLLVWDASGVTLAQRPDLYLSFEFGVAGLTEVVASYLYFKALHKVEADEAAAIANTPPPTHY